jgi:hypothetical protein
MKLEFGTSGSSGDMADFSYASQPWAAYRNAIKVVTIKSGVSSIGASAFEGIGITEVDIPATATTIAANAFKGCDSLATITVHYTSLEGVTVDESAFSAIADLSAINLIVPTGTEDIYRDTAPWKYMMDSGSKTAILETSVGSLKLSPNPTDGIVNIDNASGKLVEVYSINGSLLFQTNASVVDLGRYSSGVYVIKMGNKAAKVIKR